MSSIAIMAFWGFGIGALVYLSWTPVLFIGIVFSIDFIRFYVKDKYNAGSRFTN